MKKILTPLIFLMAISPAYALEYVTARVTVIEPSYMPSTVYFKLAAGTASCPAAGWLRWQRDADSNKVIYATLLTALVSGKQVTFHVDDGDTNCVGRFLHILDQ